MQFMNIRFVNSMCEIGRSRWDSLFPGSSPFLQFDFLQGLEAFDCVGEHVGWIPHHAVIESATNGELLAAMPLYVKTNSYGELVFDWAWADAFERSGRHYYPKLVSAIPYTPVTGSRILLSPSANSDQAVHCLIDGLKNQIKARSFSSVHCLFPEQAALVSFEQHDFVSRLGCQFHWHNPGYQSFEEYLAEMSSRKRKNVRKERQAVKVQNFAFRILQGHEITEDLWPIIYAFYKKTFDEKGGYATFTLPFFQHIGEVMGEQLLVIVAYSGSLPVACAIFYKDDEHLYGRHWGCLAQFKFLHFEVCYYLGIEYAINHGITHFEPGAQGEHKVSRGFVPTETWSSHWINDAGFSPAIAEFVRREKAYMREYIRELEKHLPFKAVESPQNNNFKN